MSFSSQSSSHNLFDYMDGQPSPEPPKGMLDITGYSPAVSLEAMKLIDEYRDERILYAQWKQRLPYSEKFGTKGMCISNMQQHKQRMVDLQERLIKLRRRR